MHDVVFSCGMATTIPCQVPRGGTEKYQGLPHSRCGARPRPSNPNRAGMASLKRRSSLEDLRSNNLNKGWNIPFLIRKVRALGFRGKGVRFGLTTATERDLTTNKRGPGQPIHCRALVVKGQTGIIG